MTPSSEQLQEWSKVSDDGSEVSIPASAWTEVLWLMRTFEKIEDNKHVQRAFAKAAAS